MTECSRNGQMAKKLYGRVEKKKKKSFENIVGIGENDGSPFSTSFVLFQRNIASMDLHNVKRRNC